MTERSFNVAMNEELTPSLQAVNNFVGAKHKVIGVFDNTDGDSSASFVLDAKFASNRQFLSQLVAIANGEDYSTQNITAKFYMSARADGKITEVELDSQTIAVPAASAGSFGTTKITDDNGVTDLVDSTSLSGTISVAAGGKVTLVGVFLDRSDIAASDMAGKINEIADNTSIQQPYRLLEVDANGVLIGNTQTKKKIDISGATSLASCILANAYNGNTNISGALDLSSLETITTNNAMYYAFNGCSNITSVDLSNLTTVTSVSSMQRAFYGTGILSLSFPQLSFIKDNNSMTWCFGNCLNLKTVSFDSLEIIGTTLSDRCLSSTFNGCTNLESISFPELKEVNAIFCWQNAFTGSKLSVVEFPKLESLLGNYAISQMFSGCSYLTDLHFPALTTSSFGNQYTNQLTNIVQSDTDVKLHFPSNLTATISGLSGYPNFGGTNTQVLFDLPATE